MQTTINGNSLEFTPRHDETALEVIRDRAGLTGTKLACGGGICGACTVLVDGTPLCSCVMPATHLDGKQVQTVERYGRDNLHPVQRALMANDGLQCGFCTPGFVNEGIAFYERWRAAHGKATPSRDEVALAMGGHLCRCAAYVGIYAALQQACAGDFDTASDLSAPRVDALEKVTGEAKYTVDTLLGGQLEGKILRSPHAHAVVKRVDGAGALALDGVAAVVDLMEGRTRVRYVGQPIAAVAAVDETTARRALDAIVVEYEVLPAAIGMDAAMDATSPEVYADGRKDVPSAAEGFDFPHRWQHNVALMPAKPTSWRPAAARRQIAATKSRAPRQVVERTFRNEQQVHTALEPHAAVAHWTGPTSLLVQASTQNVRALRHELAEHFDLEDEQVTVESQHIGGGFGGKQGLYREIIAAVTLAHQANAPVRVVASRLEDLAYTSLRPGALIDVAIASEADGTPTALRMNAFGDAGVATGSIPASGFGLMSPRVRRDLVDQNVVNNTPPGTPFRAPDAPSAHWAIEQGVDELAAQLGLDPVALRRRWFPEHAIRNRLLDWVEAIPTWQARDAQRGDGRLRRGVGMATATWLFIYNPDVQVTVSSSPAGVAVYCSTQDIGNGTRTSIAKAVEDVMGVDRHAVNVNIGNAAHPLGPTTGGSQVTASVYPTTATAAEKVVAHLATEAQTKLGLRDVKPAAGGVAHADGFTPWAEIWTVAAPFSYTEKRGAERGPMGLRVNLSRGETDPAIGMHLGHGVVVTEVEVDTRLGKIRPLNVWTAVAVGKIFVPELAKSQMLGGVIQGIGYALYEQKQYDLKTGHTLSANLNDYRIPGIGDTPDIHVHFDEEGYEDVRGQGIGLAELATIGVAASVGNAVHHATGWRPTQTPITPQAVVAGIKGA
ncbi:MAG: molybdopterin-dependent oxidoreductase [Caldilineaceae bacterium]|nr:molybdopterin-dependent oxidoreductase [Caldilineaceae bacterium]